MLTDWFSDDKNIMKIGRLLDVNQYLHIGCQLGLKKIEVDRIRQEHDGNNINLMPNILFAWRKSISRLTSDQKAKELVQALRELDLHEAADKIEDLFKWKLR